SFLPLSTERLSSMATTRRRRAPSLPKFFPEADVQRLLSLPHLRGRDRAILEVLLATGLRASELLALDAGDLRDDCLFVRRGKGGKARTVPLSQRARRSLDGLLAKAAGSGAPVFVSCHGSRLSRRGLYRIVVGYLRAAGISGSLHSTRHAAATRWLNH